MGSRALLLEGLPRTSHPCTPDSRGGGHGPSGQPPERLSDQEPQRHPRLLPWPTALQFWRHRPTPFPHPDRAPPTTWQSRPWAQCSGWVGRGWELPAWGSSHTHTHTHLCCVIVINLLTPTRLSFGASACQSVFPDPLLSPTVLQLRSVCSVPKHSLMQSRDARHLPWGNEFPFLCLG